MRGDAEVCFPGWSHVFGDIGVACNEPHRGGLRASAIPEKEGRTREQSSPAFFGSTKLIMPSVEPQRRRGGVTRVEVVQKCVAAFRDSLCLAESGTRPQKQVTSLLRALEIKSIRKMLSRAADDTGHSN